MEIVEGFFPGIPGIPFFQDSRRFLKVLSSAGGFSGNAGRPSEILDDSLRTPCGFFADSLRIFDCLRPAIDAFISISMPSFSPPASPRFPPPDSLPPSVLHFKERNEQADNRNVVNILHFSFVERIDDGKRGCFPDPLVVVVVVVVVVVAGFSLYQISTCYCCCCCCCCCLSFPSFCEAAALKASGRRQSTLDNRLIRLRYRYRHRTFTPPTSPPTSPPPQSKAIGLDRKC